MIKLWNGDDSFLPTPCYATRYCSHAKSRDIFLASLPSPRTHLPIFPCLQWRCSTLPLPQTPSFLKRTIYPIYLAILVQKSRIRFVNFLDFFNLSIRLSNRLIYNFSFRFIIILKVNNKLKKEK